MRYSLLNTVLFYNLLMKRKLSLRKLSNMVLCGLAYSRKKSVSGKYPSILIVDISNRCNLHCVACRENPTKIYNQNTKSDKSIAIGDMDLDLYKKIIAESKDHIMMAVLYVNGEPLMQKDLFTMLKYADQCRVPSMIATNGMLMTKERSEMLLSSGVDFIKIAVSGFTQEVYQAYHRGGNIETVKNNIADLVKTKNEMKSKTVIMLDYIVFEHNTSEINLFKDHCKDLGIFFNERAGLTQGRDGIAAHDEGNVTQPKDILCDWLWKIMVVNWDGAVMPCCEFTTWEDRLQMNEKGEKNFSLKDVWKGENYQKFRKLHIEKGRKSIPRCSDCHYQGVKLQG
ncbi:radical SAM/SPASM domain-containing protein [Candidatus Auribacterota bacterium]